MIQYMFWPGVILLDPTYYPGLIHKIAVGFILIQVFTVGSNLSCISLEEKSERTSQRDD